MIALIHSPFQAYSLLCYLKQNESYSRVTVVVRCYENRKDLTSIDAIKTILSDREISYYLIYNKNRFYKIGMAMYLVNRSRFLLVGDLTNPINQLIIRSGFRRQNITLLEDGTSLHVDTNEIQKYMNIFRINKIYSISNLGNDTYPTASVQQGHLSPISKLPIELNPDTFASKLLLIGTPLVDFGAMLETDYISLVNSVIAEFTKKDILYIKHRRECDELIARIDWLDNKIEIVHYPIGVDITLISAAEKLDLSETDLIAFPSTAVLMMAKIGLLGKFKSVKLIHVPNSLIVNHVERTQAINEICVQKCLEIGGIDVIY